MREVTIMYFNRHHNRFELFFRGSGEHARLFMLEHGHLHRIYRIEVSEDGTAPEKIAAAV